MQAHQAWPGIVARHPRFDLVEAFDYGRFDLAHVREPVPFDAQGEQARGSKPKGPDEVAAVYDAPVIRPLPIIPVTRAQAIHEAFRHELVAEMFPPFFRIVAPVPFLRANCIQVLLGGERAPARARSAARTLKVPAPRPGDRIDLRQDRGEHRDLRQPARLRRQDEMPNPAALDGSSELMHGWVSAAMLQLVGFALEGAHLLFECFFLVNHSFVYL